MFRNNLKTEGTIDIRTEGPATLNSLAKDMSPTEVCCKQLYQEVPPLKEVSSLQADAQLCVSSRILLHIEEQLDSREKEEILFVCQDIHFETNVLKLLDTLNERHLLLPTGLVELLHVVKRFDLMSKHLKLSRKEAEKLLMKHPRVLPNFRVLMTEINEQLEESDLDSLIFLLKGKLRCGGKLRNKTFLCLITELEKQNLVSPQNLDLILWYLEAIHRVDLKNKVLKFKKAGLTALGVSYVSAFGAPPSVSVFITQKPPPLKPTKAAYAHNGAAPIQETGAACQPTEEEDERYLVKRETMGFCLIIDCVGNDAEMLEHTFKNLNFFVQCHMHTTMKDIETILQDVANMEQHKKYDSFVCFLISRGKSDSVFGIDQSSLGLSLDNIKNFFTGQSCPYLVGKPKLFFIQSYIVCDAEEPVVDNLLEVDGHKEHRTAYEEKRCQNPTSPNEADIFWSHCKVDEIELQTSPSSPSLYLKCLSELLCDKQKRKHCHLLDIHTELNNIIYNKRPGHYLQLRHTLRKKLFLSPC